MSKLQSYLVNAWLVYNRTVWPSFNYKQLPGFRLNTKLFSFWNLQPQTSSPIEAVTWSYGTRSGWPQVLKSTVPLLKRGVLEEH